MTTAAAPTIYDRSIADRFVWFDEVAESGSGAVMCDLYVETAKGTAVLGTWVVRTPADAKAFEARVQALKDFANAVIAEHERLKEFQ